MENKKSIAELMSATMSGLRDMVDVNTIVGEPVTTADGTTIIPVTRLSMGFGTGGSEFGEKGSFGGGGGGGVKVTPVAFLIVSDQSVRLLPVSGQTETMFDKVVDLIPKVIKQAEKFMSSRKQAEEDEVP
ncbi:MAG: GerW family sporulation protein [Oscillospiraceae bacterium]|jgi:sporulation protein YtfJ|nr:GerW family sporulation protein [Oscillospiraceae bacterium]